MQVYLLDAQRQPVPIGVPGELCVSGRDLGRGYLHSPEHTAQKFTPHPYSAEPGARLYRTGDLARYLPTGVIAFLGRIDHQVKIRGVRIAPAEIEMALSRHPAVAAVVVVSRADTPATPRLVAYIVPSPDLSPSSEALRRFLQATLPASMLPSAFVFLAALPLTPNGKIDRQALPVPDPGHSPGAPAFVAPRTPVEAEIARILADVLGRERVGIHDNFFALGGHSLLAAQAIYRLREAFLMEFPLPSLFETPTVAGIATLVAQRPDGATEQASIVQALADIALLSADDIHTLLAGEHTESDGYDLTC
jgi:acyl carrier protein